MNQNKSDTMQGTLVKRPFPSTIDGDLPTPPVPPCTLEEYDQWFRAKVQEALDDPNPVYCSIEDVEAALDTVIERKRREKEARELSQS